MTATGITIDHACEATNLALSRPFSLSVARRKFVEFGDSVTGLANLV